MNADQVVNKILSEAQQQAEDILSQARQAAEQQNRQTDEELAAYQQETAQLAKEAADDKLSRLLAAARMNNGRMLLATKIELLNQVFKKAGEQLVRLPDDPYKALMHRLLSKSVQTGDEEVIVGKDEKRINEDFIKKVNRDLGTGFKGNLRLSAKRADITGGFILSRGKVQINASTQVLIERLREEMEIELAEELFGDQS